MGFIKRKGFVKPTRDLHQIHLALKGLTYFGQSCVPLAQALTFFLNSNLPKRRLLVFSGGRLSMDSAELEFYETRLKDFKVAVDVVNFGMQFVPPQKHKFLEAFVKAADNDGNSHYLYAPSGSATSLAPGGLPMQEEKKKEQEEKKKEEEVKEKEKMEHKLIEQRLLLPVEQLERWVLGLPVQEEKKKEEEVKKKEKMEQLPLQEEKKKEEEVKEREKMEHKLMEQRLLLPVEQLERWVLGLPVQEEKKKEEEVKEREKMEHKLMEQRLLLPVEQLERWVLGLPVQEEKKKEEEEGAESCIISVLASLHYSCLEMMNELHSHSSRIAY
nr:26S proteasome non-ATPase regulatory subunit 4 [Tanacetum cinerariifolium]